jgi:hypothetical protein
MNSNPYAQGNAHGPQPPPTTPQPFGGGAPGSYSESTSLSYVLVKNKSNGAELDTLKHFAHQIITAEQFS